MCDLVAVVRSVVREGCIAETVSALLIAAARGASDDPAVRGMLSDVAEQEMEHALLAWRFVRWALAAGDATLRGAVEGAFSAAEQAVGFGAVTAVRGHAAVMRAHG